jgi:hypothetical protein
MSARCGHTNGMLAVFSACSRALGPRIDAQFISRFEICSITYAFLSFVPAAPVTIVPVDGQRAHPISGSAGFHRDGDADGTRERQGFEFVAQDLHKNGPSWWLAQKEAGHLTPGDLLLQRVGVTGFEPATSSSRTKRATKLRHTPVSERGLSDEPPLV